MKKIRLIVTATILSILTLFFVGMASAQETPAATISDVEYVFEGPYTCLDFSLQIDGMAGEEVTLALWPVFYTNDSFIQSVTLDPDTMSETGELVTVMTLEVPFDSTVWDKNDDSGVSLCTFDWDFPLPTGEGNESGEPSYDFYYVLEIVDSEGYLVAINSQAETWEYTSSEIGYVRYTRNPVEVRMANAQIEPTTVAGVPGFMVYFSLETFGLESTEVRVALFAYDLFVEPLYAEPGYPDFTDPDGFITSQDVVRIPYEHSLWSPAADGNFFQLFLPYGIFPPGVTLWSPEIVVYDELTGEVLQSFLMDEVFEVEVYSD